MTKPIAAAAKGGLLVAYPIRTGWTAVGFYREVDGALHLADLTVIPGDIPQDDTSSNRRPTGVSSAAWLSESLYLEYARDAGAIEHARPNAVRARLLREVPLESMQGFADRQVRQFVDLHQALKLAKAPATQTAFGEPLLHALHDMTPAKIQYLTAAKTFAQRWRKHDNAAIAAELGVSTDELHNWLSAARKAGYLTSPGQGRRGGELTPIGKTLAARHLRGSHKEAGK